MHREAPPHVLMLGVMAGTMASHSALASLAGAALLVVVSVPCAALSRTHAFLRAHVLDLWSMALVMLALLPWGGGHHAVALPSAGAFAVVVAGWACARVWLGTRGGRGRWRGAAASCALTATGLAAMAIACAV